MVRISKQGKRRQKSPRRPKLGLTKTGPLKDHLSKGFKEHSNAVSGDLAGGIFIAKVR
jgi:hypothetical protein